MSVDQVKIALLDVLAVPIQDYKISLIVDSHQAFQLLWHHFLQTHFDEMMFAAGQQNMFLHNPCLFCCWRNHVFYCLYGIVIHQSDIASAIMNFYAVRNLGTKKGVRKVFCWLWSCSCRSCFGYFLLFCIYWLLNMGKNCAVIGCSNSTVKIYKWRTRPCVVHEGKIRKDCGCWLDPPCALR